MTMFQQGTENFARAPVPRVKRLLCIAPRGAATVQLQSGAFSGWDICIVPTLQDAAKTLQQQRYLVGLLLNCIEQFRLEELAAFLGNHWHTQWIGVFERGALQSETCRHLVADHLHDFHTMPVDTGLLKHTLGHAHGWAQLRDRPAIRAAKEATLLTGDSPAICKLRAQINRVAGVSAPVLICGESGSGKELVAKAIHEQSGSSGGPFVAINCGAMPSNLIQSELFGHERGAFTGASRDKTGLIESAQHGTIFLDEIADLPMDLQANLLRFLQERTIFRVGGTKSIRVNARVVAASHVNLQDAVNAGKFREDLFYRLNVLPITVPPLRERREDLPMLMEEFFQIFSTEKNPGLKGFSSAATDAISKYAWPGNVRELMNRIRRAMVLAEGRLITVEDMGMSASAPASSGEPLMNWRAAAEKDAILTSLNRADCNVSKAARDLGVSRMTLYRLMDKHGMRT